MNENERISSLKRAGIPITKTDQGAMYISVGGWFGGKLYRMPAAYIAAVRLR